MASSGAAGGGSVAGPFSADTLLPLAGHSLSVTLRNSPPFLSVLYATDAASGHVCFRSSPSHTYAKGEYRIVPAAEIAAIEDRGLSAEPLPNIRPVTAEEIGIRFAKASEAALKRQASRGASHALLANISSAFQDTGLLYEARASARCLWAVHRLYTRREARLSCIRASLSSALAVRAVEPMTRLARSASSLGHFFMASAPARVP